MHDKWQINNRSKLENKWLKEPSESPSQDLMSIRTEKDHNGVHPDVLTSKKGKHELSSLVRSIKMKSKQVPLHGKEPGKNGNFKVNRKKSKGDTVLLPGYGGTQVKLGDKEYHLYRDEDILGTLHE